MTENSRMRPYKVSIPEVLARAGAALRENFFGAIGMTLFAALMLVIVEAIAAGSGQGASRVIANSSGGPCQAFKAFGSIVIAALAAGAVLPLMAGYVMYTLRRGRGEVACLGTLFGSFGRYFTLIYGTLVSTLIKVGPVSLLAIVAAGTIERGDSRASWIGYIAAALAGLYVLRMTARMALWPIIAVDQRVGAIRAISLSIELMRGNSIGLTFLVLLGAIFNGAATLFPPALVLTVPFTAFAYACFYDRLLVANASRLNLKTSTGRTHSCRPAASPAPAAVTAPAAPPAAPATHGRHTAYDYEVVGAGYITLPPHQHHPAANANGQGR